MAEDWAAVAAEVEAAIASVGDVSQPEGFPAVLKRVVLGEAPNEWTPPSEETTFLTIRVVDDNRRLRDINGTLIGETVRTLMVGASVEPLKTDLVAVGITGDQAETAAQTNPDPTRYHVIQEVRPFAPAGVVLLYEIELAA